MRVHIAAKQAPQIEWTYNFGKPVSLVVVLQAYCSQFCLQTGHVTLVDHQSGTPVAPQQVVSKSTMLFAQFAPTLAFYTWQYVCWLYPKQYKEYADDDHASNIIFGHSPKLAVAFVKQFSPGPDMLDDIAALDPQQLLSEDMLPIASAPDSAAACEQLSALNVYLTFLGKCLPPISSPDSEDSAAQDPEECALDLANHASGLRRHLSLALTSVASNEGPFAANSRQCLQALILLFKVMSMVQSIAANQTNQSGAHPLISMSVLLSQELDDDLGRADAAISNVTPGVHLQCFSQLLSQLMVPAVRYTLVSEPDGDLLVDTTSALSTLLGSSNLATAASKGFCQAGGIAVLLAISGRRHNRSTAFQLIEQLLDRRHIAAEEAAATEKTLLQMQVLDYLPLALQPAFAEGEEVEAEIADRAFGSHRQKAFFDSTYYKDVTHAAKMMHHFVQLQAADWQTRFSFSPSLQAAELKQKLLQPTAGCVQDAVLDRLTTADDQNSAGDEHSKGSTAHTSDSLSSTGAAATSAPTRTSISASPQTELQEGVSQQLHPEHWPTPAPKAWKQTQTLVAQLAAVLQWTDSPVQQQKINECLAVKPDHRLHMVKQYIELRNLLMEMLHDLLLGHVLDQALDMTHVIETAFGVVMRTWAACDSPLTANKAAQERLLAHQSRCGFKLNEFHPRQLGRLFLQRISADTNLASQLFSDNDPASGPSPRCSSSISAMKAVFSLIATAEEAGKKWTGRLTAWHPDWQLLLNAAVVMVAQPNFPHRHLPADFGSMLNLLQPNLSVQMTAVTAVCTLHEAWIRSGHFANGASQYQRFAAALSRGDLDHVMTALCTAYRAQPAALSDDCMGLAYAAKQLSVLCINALPKSLCKMLFIRPVNTTQVAATLFDVEVSALTEAVTKGLGIKSSIQEWQLQAHLQYVHAAFDSPDQLMESDSLSSEQSAVLQDSDTATHMQLMAAVLDYTDCLEPVQTMHGYIRRQWWIAADAAYSIVITACDIHTLIEQTVASHAELQVTRRLIDMLKKCLQSSFLAPLPPPRSSCMEGLRRVKPLKLVGSLLKCVQSRLLSLEHGREEDWAYFGATCFRDCMRGFAQVVQHLRATALNPLDVAPIVTTFIHCAGAYTASPPEQGGQACLQWLCLLLGQLDKLVVQQRDSNRAALKERKQHIRLHQPALDTADTNLANTEQTQKAKQHKQLLNDIASYQAEIGQAPHDSALVSNSITATIAKLATDKILPPNTSHSLQCFVGLIQADYIDQDDAVERLQQELLTEEEQDKAKVAAQEAKKQKQKAKKQKQKAKRQLAAAPAAEPHGVQGGSSQAAAQSAPADRATLLECNVVSSAHAAATAPGMLSSGRPDTSTVPADAIACGLHKTQEPCSTDESWQCQAQLTGLQIAPATEDEQDAEFLQQLFCCPLTQAMMVEPAIAADGHTYERAAIQEWLLTHSTSPVTAQPLLHTRLVPNFLVKTAIRQQMEG